MGQTVIPHSCVVPHRGVRRVHGENTLESIVAAMDSGYAAVEFDVRRTIDDRWVVHHDADLARLHGSPLAIEKQPLATIREIAPLPLLEEVLDRLDGNCQPMIEIKQPTVDGLDSLCGILSGCQQSKVVIARGPDVPGELAARLPTTPVFLYTRNWDEARQRQGEGLAGYDLWRQGIDLADATEHVERLRSTGQRVAVWTVNDIDEAQAWVDAGVDFVITDVPWKLQP